MENYNKLDTESPFEWKLRLCKSKINKEIDLDWLEIVNILGLDMSADHLRKTAYGMIEYDRYIHNFDGVTTSILSISDLHVPYQLDYALLKDYIGVDILQINGDVGDMQGISKFPKCYRVSPMEEMIETRQYLIDVINYIHPKKVICNYGNHDLRYQAYLARNLDTDFLELHPETSLESIIEDGFRHFNKREGTKTEYTPLMKIFDGSVDIEYTHNWHCQIGDTIFCHPKAFSSGILKTAEKAMYWFRNEGYSFENLVMAHTHRSGQYTIGNTTIYEQGCFCDVDKNNYTDGQLINSQKEGFIYIPQNSNGDTIKDKTKLIVLN